MAGGTTYDTIRILGKDWLALTLPESPIVDGVPFDLVVTAQNGHSDAVGDIDTAYTGCQIALWITDENDEVLPYTIDGIDASETTMVSGEATFSNLRVTAGEATQVNLTVLTVESTATIKGAGFEAHSYAPEGFTSRPATTATLVFTVYPTGTVGRATTFSLTVRAADWRGNAIEGFSEIITVTLVNGASSDKFTNDTPTKTFDIQMSDGEVAMSLQIDGDSGEKTATITASCGGFTTVETEPFSIDTIPANSEIAVSFSSVGWSTAHGSGGGYYAHASADDQSGWDTEFGQAHHGTGKEYAWDTAIAAILGNRLILPYSTYGTFFSMSRGYASISIPAEYDCCIAAHLNAVGWHRGNNTGSSYEMRFYSVATAPTGDYDELLSLVAAGELAGYTTIPNGSAIETIDISIDEAIVNAAAGGYLHLVAIISADADDTPLAFPPSQGDYREVYAHANTSISLHLVTT